MISTGDDLKLLRAKLKLTRNEFGKLIGYSGIMIYFLETGRRKLTARLQYRLKELENENNERKLRPKQQAGGRNRKGRNEPGTPVAEPPCDVVSETGERVVASGS